MRLTALRAAIGVENSIRYTNNVTVENCTFTGTDQVKVGIKQYTGGCKNLVVTGCAAYRAAASSMDVVEKNERVSRLSRAQKDRLPAMEGGLVR